MALLAAALDGSFNGFAHDEVFKDDPVNLIRFFHFADTTGLDFHPDALGVMSKSLKLVDAKLRNDSEANQIFIDLLSSEKPWDGRWLYWTGTGTGKKTLL